MCTKSFSESETTPPMSSFDDILKQCEDLKGEDAKYVLKIVIRDAAETMGYVLDINQPFLPPSCKIKKRRVQVDGAMISDDGKKKIEKFILTKNLSR